MVLLLQIISGSVGFSFGRKDKLKRHMDTVHSDAKPFKCDFCSTSFNRRDKLKQHVSSIHSALVLQQQQQEQSNPFEPGMLTLNLVFYGFFCLYSKIQRTHVLAICKFVLNSIPESIQKPFWRLISRPWSDKKIPLEVRRIRRHRAVPNQKFRTRGTTFSSTDTKTAPTTIHLQQPTYQWAIHKAHSIRLNQPLLHAENIRYGLYA